MIWPFVETVVLVRGKILSYRPDVNVGPEKPLFDKMWQLPDIEKAN
jgi:hypothetical protein